MSKIDYQALREAAVAIETVATPQKLLAFRMKVTPQVVLALLDERERNQQYIKSRDQENEEIALTVGKLRVELEAARRDSAGWLNKFEEAVLNCYHKADQIEELEAKLAASEAEPGRQTYKQTFLEWLSEQKEKIDVDCGCVSIETLTHWMKAAYEAGNSPVTPDGWISCSERVPAQDDWILIYSKHSEYMAGQVQGEYVELSDGTLSWLGNALFWMPLPAPPQEVRQ